MRIDWRDLRKPVPLLALLALVLLTVALLLRGWDAYVEDSLSRWAVERLASRTDGAYRLSLGDLSFVPLAGSVAFDSAAIATDTVRNGRRPTPLPTVRARLEDCRMTGINLVRLALGRALDARALECGSVTAHVALTGARAGPAAPADSAPRAAEPGDVPLPLGLTSLRLDGVSFPSLDLSLERPGSRGPASLVLERARFEAEDIDLEPGKALAQRARVHAGGFVLRPDTLIELSVDSLEADLTDSTLDLIGVRHEPTIPEAEWLRRVKVRRDRIRFTLDRLQGRGVSYRDFLAEGGIAMRALELHDARLDVLSDRRIPKGRGGRPRRTPQQVAAQPRSPLRLDTVLVRGGAIVYRERKPETEGPGVVSFEELRATILDLDLPSRGRPLRVEARAKVMGEGTLTARATVPLDAPDFRYELSGTLGGMPAKAFNRYLSVNESFEFDNGVVDEITIVQTVRAGRAVTAVTPRYRELSVEPSGEGGGVIGAVTRGVKDFIADAFVVRSRNPDEDGTKLRTGRTVRRYSPERSWLQFMWFAIRDGLLATIKE